MKVAIIGAGITGRTTAYALERAGLMTRGWAIDLFDAGHQVGGVIETAHWEDAATELGPDSLVDKAQRVVGLGEKLRAVNGDAKPPRWLKVDGWHDFPRQDLRSFKHTGFACYRNGRRLVFGGVGRTIWTICGATVSDARFYSGFAETGHCRRGSVD